jgi:hypothetical protein
VATTFRLSEDTYLEPDVVIFTRASVIAGFIGANALLVVEIADSSRPAPGHARVLSFTTLCRVASAVSRKRLIPRAAWRMRCSFSTRARRT